ncbi:hypothetical protein BJ322DRAFT_1105226 [Thelephora terrestris]|uniref:Uncharacterized protein n=1 Tax=Thelephora terrestris TaxID=56493 RepID=A0A9P6HL95_9AGAM|nr:hypothetical protein BJ322DRAFT_1105226 [Thelephora terrestris]
MAPQNILRQLRELEKTSPQFYERLRGFLRGDVYRDALRNLPKEELTSLVEYLDSILVDILDRTIPSVSQSPFSYFFPMTHGPYGVTKSHDPWPYVAVRQVQIPMTHGPYNGVWAP